MDRALFPMLPIMAAILWLLWSEVLALDMLSAYGDNVWIRMLGVASTPSLPTVAKNRRRKWFAISQGARRTAKRFAEITGKRKPPSPKPSVVAPNDVVTE